MSTLSNKSMDKAAKAVGQLIDPLVDALVQIDLNLSRLDPEGITAAMKMLGRLEGTASEHQAFELIQAELKKHLARHLAKTADSFELGVRLEDGIGWTLNLWAVGGQVLQCTFLTHEAARAAGATLCAFLRLRGDCDFSYEVPATGHSGHEPELPF